MVLVARELMQAVERPLRYVQEGDPKRLKHVKNLSQHILSIARQALSSFELQGREAEIFRSLQKLFYHYDVLSEPEKRKRIGTALSLIASKKALSDKKYFLPQDHPAIDVARLKANQKRLKKSVQFLKGVGPAISAKLSRISICTIEDLLLFLPVRYEDRRQITKIKDLQEGVRATVMGQVMFHGIAFYRGLRRRVYEIVIQDETGSIKLKWFQFSSGSFEKRIKRDQKLIISGVPRLYRSKFEMHHPDFEIFFGQHDSLSFGRVIPIYREVGGIHQRTLRKIMNYAVSAYAGERSCVIPSDICHRYDLLPPWKALMGLHHPKQILSEENILELKRVFSFEELFFYCLFLALRKKELQRRKGIAFSKQTPRFEKLIQTLPFELTSAQKMVLSTIREDMTSPRPMNRLLQGDVGSGKTIVAMLSALIAIDHGYQVAFMAPTEILAEQHMQNLAPWAVQTDVFVQSLLGRHTPKEKEEILAKLKKGKINLLVGTHALLEDQVEFQALGLVIVDEQHRFGVEQRAKIRSKAQEPDVLVMSATPIPRTLALTLYGDLDISILNQLPQGRKPIETRLYRESDRAKVYQELRKEVQKGRQAYVVYPLVETSDRLDAKDATSMAQIFQREIFPEFRIELIHGQMPSQEKEEVMKRFKSGAIDVLVSTTVIEVGIDVANATVMLIEHPERFGLSQLHQLRGRVGRGSEKSFCMMISPPQISQVAKDRLRTFAQIHDGFLLAEEDLKLRGPGDFFGVAQTGFPNFLMASFPRDLELLQMARREAFSLVSQDSDLQNSFYRHLKWMLKEVWVERLHLAQVG